MAIIYCILIISATISSIIFSSNSWIISFADAKPIAALEFYRPYEHRSAMNTLKELDKYYSQVARPRFGKRGNLSKDNIIDTNSSSNNNFAEASSSLQQQQPPTSSSSSSLSSSSSASNNEMIIDNGPYRWILINRDQPLTKLTQPII